MKQSLRTTTAALLVTLLLGACAEPTTPPQATAAPETTEAAFARSAADAIPGSYIVVLKESVAASRVPEVARAHVGQGRVKHTYSQVLKGFAADLSDAEVAALRNDPDVDYVEADQVMAATTTQSSATWGLDRIDQRNRPLSGTYTYTATASTVRAYIIDTGIQTAHSQFGGRASNVYDAFGGNGQDCNGHGTHVAGTVGSATYGVAKAVMLRGVRVLDCNGSGSTSGIIAALDWLRTNHIKPAVANMSLGGGYSSSLNTAVNNLAAAGVFVAVAAGNENQDACNVSPASAANTTTVAASTSTDAKASYSNWGGCVDLYAPGSSITSTWLNGGTNTISGTSMASPHVAGVAALYKATYGDASYSTIRSWLINNSTASVISGNVSGTPNRLLYKAGL
ncbi:MAG TPA: S8 family peptidase [Gemmatimonadaceae bacterium]|nr:S8 family peptidase [Gemmatimonadaceae bacterium]